MLSQLVEHMRGNRGDDRYRVAAYTLGSLKDAALTTDSSGRIIYLNPPAEKLTGWHCSETRGISSARVIRLVDPATLTPIADPVAQALQQACPVPFQAGAALICRSGQHFAVHGHVAPIINGYRQTSGAVVILYNAAVSLEWANRTPPAEHYDALTGLVSRREFERRVERALLSAYNQGLQHSLCHIDLSRFKIVNETCGHRIGDALLSELSEMLQSRVCLRDSDSLARLAGDEFALLLESCPLERARDIAREVLSAVRDFCFDYNGATFRLGASVGVIALPPKLENAAALLSAFSAACYAKKDKARNQVKVYDAGDLELAMRRGEMRWVNQVSDALLENRLTLFSQPFVALGAAKNRNEHQEILVRMIGSGNQLIPPLHFLPTAERYNLMPHLDRWVIENAFAAYAKGGKGIWTINISPSTLGSYGMVQFVREASRKHRVPASAICFEIAESAVAAHVAHSLDFFWELKSDGFRFALDRFATGDGSFSNLRTWPVDFLKVEGEAASGDERTLDVIVRVCEALGVETIAQRVETEAALKKLKAMGVRYVQGHLTGRPEPLDARIVRGGRGRS